MKKRLIIAGSLCAAILAVKWLSPRPYSIAWQVTIPGLRGEVLSVGNDGSVYVEADRRLLAFDGNGKQRWASPQGVKIDSSPVIGHDGSVYATGEIANRKPKTGVSDLGPDGLLKWWFPIDGKVEGLGNPLVMDKNDTIYFGVKLLNGSKTIFAIGSPEMSVRAKIEGDLFNVIEGGKSSKSGFCSWEELWLSGHAVDWFHPRFPFPFPEGPIERENRETQAGAMPKTLVAISEGQHNGSLSDLAKKRQPFPQKLCAASPVR